MNMYGDIDSGDKAEFCRLLGICMQRGVPILQAVGIAGQSARNTRVKEAADCLISDLKSGHSFTGGNFLELFREFQDGRFDAYAPSGEDVGELDTCLLMLAEQYARLRKASPSCLLCEGEPVGCLTKHLGDLIGMGFSVLSSLKACERLLERLHFRIMAEAVRFLIQEIERGATLSEALAKRSDLFSEQFVFYVRTGESLGDLDRCLKEIIEQ